MSHTVCVFTGTRADYGLLKPLMERLRRDERFRLRLLVSGSHLSVDHGLTVSEIRDDGFEPDACVEMLLASDTAVGVCSGMGLALSGYGPALQRLAPDILVVLGDRYEALCAALAAVVLGVPVAHVAGGELTYGAMDDAFRHAITKLASLHFTSAEPYRRRVIQMGEDPATVVTVGDPGLDDLTSLPLLSREDVAGILSLPPRLPYLLVTFHPVTREAADSAGQCAALLEALEAFPDLGIVFTGVNADAGGRELSRLIADRAGRHPGTWRSFASLGRLRYLSAMRHTVAVVGNSSSGVLESPSFQVPAVDIGSRQGGRLRADNVLHVAPRAEAITAAIRQTLTPEFRAKARQAKNPCELPGGLDRMVAALHDWLEGPRGLKTFHDQ